MRALLRSFGVMLAALWLLDAAAQLPTPEVLTLKLSMSNVHAIKGARTVLVDAGSKADLARLEAELARAGVAWKDIAAVIAPYTVEPADAHEPEVKT